MTHERPNTNHRILRELAAFSFGAALSVLAGGVATAMVDALYPAELALAEWSTHAAFAQVVLAGFLMEDLLFVGAASRVLPRHALRSLTVRLLIVSLIVVIVDALGAWFVASHGSFAELRRWAVALGTIAALTRLGLRVWPFIRAARTTNRRVGAACLLWLTCSTVMTWFHQGVLGLAVCFFSMSYGTVWVLLAPRGSGARPRR